jgi:phosphoribosylanthranilate isomerase
MVEVKICGLSTAETVAAAVGGGARFVGFIFYPRSPRNVTPDQAGALARTVPTSIDRVGVFVDPDDAFLEEVLSKAPLSILQLHGSETPDRVVAIRRRFGRPVMKAISVAGPADLEQAPSYFAVADRLLFDAKPPRQMPGTLPGGNGLSFDWSLLYRRAWPLPWMLSGGLDADNLAEAVRLSGARIVDVSSGVEAAPGRKDRAKMQGFLARAQAMRADDDAQGN